MLNERKIIAIFALGLDAFSNYYFNEFLLNYNVVNNEEFLYEEGIDNKLGKKCYYSFMKIFSSLSLGIDKSINAPE